MNQQVERRFSSRISFNRPATSHSATGKQERTVAGTALDIGGGGLRLRLPLSSKLRKGDSIKVSINTKEPKGSVNVQGHVRWLKPSPGSEKESDVGVQLTGDELARWVLWLEGFSALDS